MSPTRKSLRAREPAPGNPAEIEAAMAPGSPAPTPQLNGGAASRPKHLPGPVRIVENLKSVSINGHPHECIAIGNADTGACVVILPAEDATTRTRAERSATARRIVASYNACEGINPEAVKDLLAACRAAECYVADWFRLKMAEHGPGWVGRAAPSVLDDLRAAIAKATGGAA